MNTDPTLTLTVDGLDVSVTFDRWDALQNNRARWTYRIAAAGTTDVLAEGDDLTTVVPGQRVPNYPDALETLLTFLAAHLEAVSYSHRTGRPLTELDSGTLFPPAIAERTSLSGDDVTLWAELLKSEAE